MAANNSSNRAWAFAGCLPGPLQQPGEQLVGQELDVLGKEAEQHLLAEMGDPRGVMTAQAPGLGQSAQLSGGFLGELRRGDGGA
jgi:hypothetical protein